MKTLIKILSPIVFVLPATAQDTLYSRNGEVTVAKVIEVNQTEIKYKRTSNPDGPLYVTDKNLYVLIHYQNGSKDVFANTGPSPENTEHRSADGDDSPRRSRSTVIISPPAIFAWTGWGWGWNWNRWNYTRPYYGGWGRRYHGGFGGGHHGYYGGHHGHSGHYGPRGHR